MKLSWFGEVSHGNKGLITYDLLLDYLVVIKLVIFKHTARDPIFLSPFQENVEAKGAFDGINLQFIKVPHQEQWTTKIIFRVNPPHCLLIGILIWVSLILLIFPFMFLILPVFIRLGFILCTLILPKRKIPITIPSLR
jgi:hypothetical protein